MFQCCYFNFKLECVMTYYVGLFLMFAIYGCSTFTTEKIMKVKQGMTSDEILQMFGQPKNIRQAVCGADTGHIWNCTTWEYNNTFEDGKASFTFSGEPGAYLLNDFSIDR